MVLDFICISAIVVLVVFGFLTTSEKRQLSLLNRSLKEAWNHENKAVKHQFISSGLDIFSTVEAVKEIFIY